MIEWRKLPRGPRQARPRSGPAVYPGRTTGRSPAQLKRLRALRSVQGFPADARGPTYRHFAAPEAANHEKAVERHSKSRNDLLACSGQPGDHWRPLRTTWPIKSVFATGRTW